MPVNKFNDLIPKKLIIDDNAKKLYDTTLISSFPKQ